MTRKLAAWGPLTACFVLVASAASQAEDTLQRLKPVLFTQVRIADEFWTPRIETNRQTTIPYDFRKCEVTGRISNFARAGGLEDGPHQGYVFNDSDVYKVVEGAAYSLANQPDPELDKYLDNLIAKMAAAQEDDGYLNTSYTLRAPDRRWTNVRNDHELYCAGHLFEAAAAHYQATGKRTLLDVAVKFADYIDSVFGPEKRHDVPGHEEIEMGLVKLHLVTGEDRYLKLAKFFIDERGHARGRQTYGPYCQDHVPVVEQSEAVGHAVRAGYLYCGMADVAVLTGDRDYIKAIDRIWDNVVSKKLYVTGGIGASPHGEAFGENYELPNKNAYNETCAAIANAMWNHRMNLLHADAKYADVIELVLYNGFLAGVSLGGQEFHYPNPLAADGSSQFNQGSPRRQGWFACSCCPVNVVRLFPSLSGYVYAQSDDDLYVNLYASGTARVEIDEQEVKVTQQTKYPWDGRVKIRVKPAEEAEFAVNLRIPSWCVGPSPVPSDLYRFDDEKGQGIDAVGLKVNGHDVGPLTVERGYVRLARRWKPGDEIELNLPMPVRRVKSHTNVKENQGLVALMRGPIVYCLEAVDNGGYVRNLSIPADATFESVERSDLLGGVVTLEGQATAQHAVKDEQRVESRPAKFTAIPYYAWNHRTQGEMAVWMPEDPSRAGAVPLPTVASNSRVSASYVRDSIQAVNDQIDPASSNDQGVPRFTWWNHEGTQEWLQYEFRKPKKVSQVDVYWFVDAPQGGCDVPQSWKVLYKQGDAWKPVENPSGYGIEKDALNRVTFDPVETPALRLEVQLQDGRSGGVLEWRVK